MILQSLHDLYGRLLEDEHEDIAAYGFSRQNISFRVVLEEDGSLHAIEPFTTEVDGKDRPVRMVVPGGAKPSGSGINPGLLWDNTAYLLGFKPDDSNPERTRQAFEAFRDRHIELAADEDGGPNDPAFGAVAKFLADWDPEAADAEHLGSLLPGFGVFVMRSSGEYVHQSPNFADWWQQQIVAGEDDPKGAMTAMCLVTGETSPIARLHEPRIKGVVGAQSSGHPLVSFNSNAYESHGFDGGFNAPVSQEAAFRYCTALNRLLSPESNRKLRIGDATTVFWTERASPGEELFGAAIDPSAVEEEFRGKMRSTLDAIANGKPPAFDLGDPEMPFYVLGLAPNAARSVVRFWQQSTVGEMAGRLAAHFAALEIVPSFPNDPPLPAVWQLLRETARETKDIPPLLPGAVMRAILTGSPYPESFLMALVRRIRADREVPYLRAAAIKACLVRSSQPLELSVSLDPERPESAYQLGRLFACLERAQEDAYDRKLNATIRDKFFGAASATPASVFPRLMRLSQHHLSKLEGGRRVVADKRMQEVCSRFDDFPKHLNLRQQGLFAIGYYHQRRDFFTKTEDAEATSTDD